MAATADVDALRRALEGCVQACAGEPAAGDAAAHAQARRASAAAVRAAASRLDARFAASAAASVADPSRRTARELERDVAQLEALLAEKRRLAGASGSRMDDWQRRLDGLAAESTTLLWASDHAQDATTAGCGAADGART